MSLLTAPADELVQVLQLAARLHMARGDPNAWRVALKACSEWLSCPGVMRLSVARPSFDSDALEGLAGRVTHCAVNGACGSGSDDVIRRARCAALATHLHLAAEEARSAFHAVFFDQLPPTWIVDRDGRIRDCNASAKAMVAGNALLLTVAEGALAPDVPGGGARLRRTLAGLDHECRFSWPNQSGSDTTLLLRPLPAGAAIAVTLLPEPPTVVQLAPLLAQRLNITLRQSELGAHLLTGKPLSDAARAMGISRHTANEHLAGLLKRAGAPNRTALFAILRRAATG